MSNGAIGGALGGLAGMGIGAASGWGKSQGVSRKKTASFLGNSFIGASGGGLTTYFDQNEANKSGYGFKVQREQNRQDAITGVRQAYANTAKGLGELQAQVTPGYGRLTEAAVQSIRNAEQRGKSDLTAQFAQRRLAGSSFAADKVSNLSAQAAQDESQARSEAFLQELQLNASLMEQKGAYEAQSFQTELDNLNIEAGLAQDMQNQMAGVTSNLNTALMKASMDYQGQNSQTLTWGLSSIGSGLTSGSGKIGGYLSKWI